MIREEHLSIICCILVRRDCLVAVEIIQTLFLTMTLTLFFINPIITIVLA